MSIKHLTLALLMAMLATSIQAETINCTPITSLPATITVQGLYCLTGNLVTSQTSGNTITINVPNVTIDLNGWKLGGQGAGAGTQAYGIYSTANNVTIKNGIVRGFYWGIFLTGSGATVQDMLIDSNTYVGMTVDGSGSIVEHNQVVNSGNGTYRAYGIDAEGDNETVINNVVSGLTSASGQSEYAILLYGNNSTARGNVISNTALPAGGGNSYGIYTLGGIATSNMVSNFVYGIYNGAAAIYSFNTVYSCTNDFTGGTAGFGNSGT